VLKGLHQIIPSALNEKRNLPLPLWRKSSCVFVLFEVSGRRVFGGVSAAPLPFLGIGNDVVGTYGKYVRLGEREFLQHVLPLSFHRVRRFGWLHPGGRAKLKRVRALLKIPLLLSAAGQAAWQPPAPSTQSSPIPAAHSDALKPAPPRCPHCGRKLLLIGQWRPGQDGRPV
jgi:hypothetical protein